MVNAARSPTFYEFDSVDLLRLYREMDDRDEEPVVIYHSHTATEAYPSRTDISYASEPDAHYVLVSTRTHRDGRRVPVVPDRGRRGHRGRSSGRPRRWTRSSRTLTRRPAADRSAAAPVTRRPTTMAVEVRIPTILRTYTGGAKAVEGAGAHPRRADRRPRARHPGPARAPGRRDGALRRFVNVYLNDEDVRFLGGLDTPVADGDTVTILPAVAGG